MKNYPQTIENSVTNLKSINEGDEINHQSGSIEMSLNKASSSGPFNVKGST